ncbi:hypothetical protein GCM10028803_20270 [Larkinella knui]|uniref:Uncharacterized protein n=1 Tax=Larkinella knui TaxID=2025310 RepID=A0A3P1CV14_9BACT|nr:hypothetical protein [Larkinella knui]RRB17113.1 hypothetical protein EHT87_02200 [Larkinella knui]
MKLLFYGWLLMISPLAFAKKPDTAPKAPFTGMTTITWIGFGNQTVSSPIPVGVVTMTAPTPFAYPKKVDIQKNVYYQEIVLVNSTFKPANPVTKPPIVGNWFVRRQVLSVKDGKTEVLQTTRLSINKNAEATDKADQSLSAKATHVEYRIGRTEKIIGKPGPGKILKTTTIEVFPHDAVRIALPMATIFSNICQVKDVVTRPIPCEFQMVKFQIIGKSGKVLYETSAVENGPAIKIPDEEWVKTDGAFRYIDAKWTIKRIHKPNFPVNKGYLISWGQSGSDFNAEVDTHAPLASDLQLDGTIGKEFTIPFQVKKSSPNTGLVTKVGELILENDVTKTKFSKSQMPGATRAEAYIRLNW